MPGRGDIRFPEFLELKVTGDGTKGDCLVYPDSPSMRKKLLTRKCKYNSDQTGQFAGRFFRHFYEQRDEGPVIVIQRIR